MQNWLLERKERTKDGGVFAVYRNGYDLMYQIVDYSRGVSIKRIMPKALLLGVDKHEI